MSARLTLLVFCDPSEIHSLFVSALVAADFYVMVAHSAEQATRILANLAVDAIMIKHSDFAEFEGIGPALKRVAPRTPVLLFDNQALGPQSGIDSICRADLTDEIVAFGVAAFFRQSLTSSRRPITVTLRTGSIAYPMSQRAQVTA